jgi:hypothetical protein
MDPALQSTEGASLRTSQSAPLIPLSASLHASLRSVAFLWGAPKATNSPMDIGLVVDHIIEGDKTNYSINNLQFLTVAENTRKSGHHRRGANQQQQ